MPLYLLLPIILFFPAIAGIALTFSQGNLPFDNLVLAGFLLSILWIGKRNLLTPIGLSSIALLTLFSFIIPDGYMIDNEILWILGGFLIFGISAYINSLGETIRVNSILILFTGLFSAIWILLPMEDLPYGEMTTKWHIQILGFSLLLNGYTAARLFPENHPLRSLFYIIPTFTSLVLGYNDYFSIVIIASISLLPWFIKPAARISVGIAIAGSLLGGTIGMLFSPTTTTWTRIPVSYDVGYVIPALIIAYLVITGYGVYKANKYTWTTKLFYYSIFSYFFLAVFNNILSGPGWLIFGGFYGSILSEYFKRPDLIIKDKFLFPDLNKPDSIIEDKFISPNLHESNTGEKTKEHSPLPNTQHNLSDKQYKDSSKTGKSETKDNNKENNAGVYKSMVSKNPPMQSRDMKEILEKQSKVNVLKPAKDHLKPAPEKAKIYTNRENGKSLPELDVNWNIFPKNWSKLSDVEKTNTAGDLIQEITDSIKEVKESGKFTTNKLKFSEWFKKKENDNNSSRALPSLNEKPIPKEPGLKKPSVDALKKLSDRLPKLRKTGFGEAKKETKSEDKPVKQSSLVNTITISDEDL